ncbi:atypical chemokine receptor 4 [Rhineura floridana]|uniref:atypical chemokine receptor 4 n=1 Tax=Rhineura floridana TaxID=261503 RepID=UPI002AC835F4|nr:atypical chemokine receptor 4 [Rhineura floridana]
MEPYINSSEGYYYYDDDELNATVDYTLYEMLCHKEGVRTFSKSFLPAFYSTVFLVGLAGNSLVVAFFAFIKKLKARTNVYLMNLAIADLLLLFTLPFWAANATHGWVLGIPLCKITSAIYTMTFSASMQFLACISVDRYNTIVKSQGQPQAMKQCGKTSFFVWAAAMFLCIPDLIFTTVMESHGRFVCLSAFPESTGKAINVTIEIMEMLLSFILPFLIMLFCYSAVAKALIKSPSVKKCQPLKVLAAVVLVFIITQLPYNIVKLWRAINIIYPLIRDCSVSKTIDVIFQVTNCIALFHCCLNPILYFFMGASFKMHIVKIAKRYGYWRRQQSTGTEEIPMDFEDSAQETSSFTI